ncbi:MAG: glucodextranase DOMON-like domain-containing protein, partial [Candidatus Promineifilaceae bacterium]|nr:glucodextranase DOMON-like domain-containing protein [Candidatus Promineifilaceae bacterium]
ESSPAEEVEPTEAAITSVEEPIYLSIIWHQHQPVYFKDPESNTYIRPWVRVHATKDYVDMAAILDQYPDIHATFNLTPSLIRQLDDLSAGAKDLYWTLAEIPAEDLTDEQKQFILDRFFDTNRKMVARFPRYQELLEKRDGSEDARAEFTVEDFRDLQILFNLAWVDPDWLAQEPLAELVAKGENFAETDKEVLFAEHQRLIEEVLPVHKRLQDTGQIEVTTTPFAHPILPLLVDTNLAREALPDIELPETRFVYGQDAVAQVELGVQLYEEHFERPPRGMWPAEGSVAQEIVTMVSQNGLQWMASDEGVLANSLGFDSFTRDAQEVVVEADQLYRPYFVQGSRGEPVAMVFRDVVLSDKVGFTYSGMQGEQAAEDFVRRIHAIRQKLKEEGAQGPHLVSVILDGENAWEHYDNDGQEFLHTLYQMLSDDPLIETVTPTEVIELAPDQPRIEDLHAGSWINHDFSTWIGEEEENRAWEYLAETRDFLQQYITGSRADSISAEALDAAINQMYIAEGSDWFWWYGADQNSGNDQSFDEQFRATLKQVYFELGEEPPTFLDVPIIPEEAATADRLATSIITPIIDGVIDEGEWEGSGRYVASGGAMAASQPFFESLTYGFDAKNLALNLTANSDGGTVSGPGFIQLYFSTPGGGEVSSFSQYDSLLGFPANHMLELMLEGQELAGAKFFNVTDNKWVERGAVEGSGSLVLSYADDVEGEIAAQGSEIELAVPLAALGNVDEGSEIIMNALYLDAAGNNRVEVQRIPGSGPAVFVAPDLGTTTVVVEIMDPENDDYGPGGYIYPQDGVFNSGNFDIQQFQVGYSENDIVFKFNMRGPVENVWDSPNGLSLQTFDIYIDKDSDGSGGEMMLPGRNIAFQDEYRWDYALTIEGWTPGVYVPGAEGPQEIAGSSEFQVLADPGQRIVTIRVPKTILGDNPENWRFAAGVMSQEGFPSGGVMRVRDVVEEAEQWRIGGAPPGTTNHTRVIDLVWPEAGQQETWLSDFSPTDVTQTQLLPADFARVPMFAAD